MNIFKKEKPKSKKKFNVEFNFTKEPSIIIQNVDFVFHGNDCVYCKCDDETIAVVQKRNNFEFWRRK